MCRVISEADSDVLKKLPLSCSNAVSTKEQTPLLGEVIAVCCHKRTLSITAWENTNSH